MALVVATCPQCRTEEEVAISADQHVGQWEPVVSVLVLCDDCRGFQKTLRENYYSPAGELAAYGGLKFRGAKAEGARTAEGTAR
jgi:hypothetical protein